MSLDCLTGVRCHLLPSHVQSQVRPDGESVLCEESLGDDLAEDQDKGYRQDNGNLVLIQEDEELIQESA
jgi:hypothetical protein